jgi:hypothetical protein
MKATFAAVLMLLTAVAHADGPVALRPGGGGHDLLPGGRDACWSEPPDLEGNAISSEIINDFGIVTECANDFVLGGNLITKATFWGEWEGMQDCQPPQPTPGFNFKFYEDQACLPGTLIADLSITDFTEEMVGCWHGFDPQYKWSADISVDIVAGNRYWFVAQMKDHVFPGQHMRIGALGITGCESAFRSDYFSYPDWVPISGMGSSPLDVSQEFECEQGTAVERTSWGAIRTLFRLRD